MTPDTLVTPWLQVLGPKKTTGTLVCPTQFWFLAATATNVLLGEEIHRRRGHGSLLQCRSTVGGWCVSMDPPVQQGMVDICRDGGRSQGPECLLNQCPLHMELHKLLNQGKREVSAWGPAPARATSHTHTGLHQLGPDQRLFSIPNAGSHHLSAFL